MSNFCEQHRKRMAVIQAIRDGLNGRGFEEVLCPILHTSVPAEPTIYPFVTRWDRYHEHKLNSMNLYLPLSPERAMKHYLARGFEQIYSIGHCCRNMEDAGPTHHPEFLMLEWYRTGADYRAIMDDTRELLIEIAQKVNGSAVVEVHGVQYDLREWEQLSVAELWEKYIGVDIADVIEEKQMQKLAEKKGYDTTGTWEQLFNQMFLNEVETKLPKNPFFLIDFPAKLSPLCRPRENYPWLAERFEVYVDGVELGNGNSEQLDVGQIRRLFREEIKRREEIGEAAPPLDESMLADIAGMARRGQQYAGIGLGVDRVAMLLCGVESINAWWPKFEQN